MKITELRSMMQGYIQDATQSEVPNITLLDRMMEDIEVYTEQKILDSTNVRTSKSCSDILAGPYWERQKQYDRVEELNK